MRYRKQITNGGCGAAANTARVPWRMTQQDWQSKSRCSAIYRAWAKQRAAIVRQNQKERAWKDQAIWHHKECYAVGMLKRKRWVRWVRMKSRSIYVWVCWAWTKNKTNTLEGNESEEPLSVASNILFHKYKTERLFEWSILNRISLRSLLFSHPNHFLKVNAQWKRAVSSIFMEELKLIRVNLFHSIRQRLIENSKFNRNGESNELTIQFLQIGSQNKIEVVGPMY